MITNAPKATVTVPAAADQTAGQPSDSPISSEDAEKLSHYASEQQVAIILTKLGLNDAPASSGIRMKDLARKAAGEITGDLSSMVTHEEITSDGVTAT